MTHDRFHPAVRAWFAQAFPAGATAAQDAAWPAIADGRHTLIAAPTGSGKTLAAFLAAIDALVREGVAGTLTDATRVVYVSPLKALSNDIQRNLEWPLAGIREQLQHLGLPDVAIRTAVRTGDTPPAERASMAKLPPHILVTTPESLYLLLTSESGRAMLGEVRTVIVDEIHAVAASKRGAHLALSLERLAALSTQPLVRVGLSATQKPIEEVARFLIGARSDDCVIVDTGHVRERDLALALPDAPLDAVMSNDNWEQIYDRLARLIDAHRTTLIFVNTRRLAERLTRHLSERVGREHIASHHGSLSKEHRLDAERRLKGGALRALVATASLELGIDIGDVDLVCQIGSPRSIAAFLQRVGRAGHAVGAIPKGRLFPLSRDELVECAALLDAVARGELDRLRIPQQPLDVLAQQIVAEVAAREWGEDELFAWVRRAWPYRALAQHEFDQVIATLSEGYATRRGRHSAYLHRDAVNRRLRGRRGARLTALTCGGAIPDTADYAVILEPSEIFIGTVNEDFAVESMAGDIFQLGNTSYRVRRVEAGRVRVEDAHGQPPSIPFWIGEAPARTDELSGAVSRLRADVAARLLEVDTAHVEDAIAWLASHYRLDTAVARQIVEHLAAARAVLGAMPTQDTIILERFFDESGGMQLVLHAPFGSRINRAWGLALRKRFCRQFNFELQAAATEDAIVLSLGETHSFPLEGVARYVHSRSVRDVLIQATLDAPVFATRWRWSATIALAIKRFRGGRKTPPPLQRMDAEDLIAVVFPDQIACAENLAGPREVPDHPLVKQVVDDCLHEAMDIDGLIAVLIALEAGDKQLLARDLPHPSPLALEILNAKPYAFLDDAPLEERRTQAVASRRWLDPISAGDLGKLDPAAIDAVRAEAWPGVESADELHDALMLLGALNEVEGERAGWCTHLDTLIANHRATRLRVAAHTFWVAAERVPLAHAIWPHPESQPPLAVPAGFAFSGTREQAIVELLRGRVQASGPTTADALAMLFGLGSEEIDAGLHALEGEGVVLRGQFTTSVVSSRDSREQPSPSFPLPEGEGGEASRIAGAAHTPPSLSFTLPAGEGGEVAPDHPARSRDLSSVDVAVGAAGAARTPPSPSFPLPEGEGGEVAPGHPWPSRHSSSMDVAASTVRALFKIEWCERRLLARIHRYTLRTLRAEIEPVSVADFMRFLFQWHGLAGEVRPEGPQALMAAIARLEGYEAPAAAWETDVLPARVRDYDPGALDALCQSGRVVWRRLTPTRGNGDARGPGTVRATPIALLARANLALWQTLAEREDTSTSRWSPAAEAVAQHLRAHGASFFDDILAGTRLLNSQAEGALGELVAAGRVSADSFSGLRALLTPADRRRGHRRRRAPIFGIDEAGRWSWLPTRGAHVDDDAAIEHAARALLARYGVVFRKLLEREGDWLPPWYALLRVYRRLEARGEIRGGRFVAGVTGEQYALTEAVSALRGVRRQAAAGELVSLSAADPLNLVGVITPGARLPAIAGNRVLFRDGVPLAVQSGGDTRFLDQIDPQAEWAARNALLRTTLPAVRRYLN